MYMYILHVQLKSDCPRIGEVADTLVQVLTEMPVNLAIQQDDPSLQQLFEGLFSHFFSTHRTSYHHVDCKWFLQLVNENLDLSSASVGEHSSGDSDGSESESTGCISVGVYKMYLTRILGSTETSDSSMVSCPALYKQSVCLFVCMSLVSLSVCCLSVSFMYNVHICHLLSSCMLLFHRFVDLLALY